MLNCHTHAVNPREGTGCNAGTTSNHSFLANHFRYYLTLFSKFFSPFLHSTCSLSVNRRYLVLDGVYHPLRAAIPSNPTRREHIQRKASRSRTGLSPSGMPRSSGLISARQPDEASIDYNSQKEIDNLHCPRFIWLARRYKSAGTRHPRG